MRRLGAIRPLARLLRFWAWDLPRHIGREPTCRATTHDTCTPPSASSDDRALEIVGEDPREVVGSLDQPWDELLRLRDPDDPAVLAALELVLLELALLAVCTAR